MASKGKHLRYRYGSLLERRMNLVRVELADNVVSRGRPIVIKEMFINFTIYEEASTMSPRIDMIRRYD
jgi:hypothetical protein